MKRFLKYSSLVMLACMMSLMAQARVISIDAKSIKGDLTKELRTRSERVSNKDTLLLNFPKGTYTIDGSVTMRCHVIIKGAGRDKSTVILDKGTDRGGFKAFTGDTYFMLRGNLKNPINVSISDISFKMRDHNGIWWSDAEKYIFQIHHSNSVIIRDVNGYLVNANATIFNLHVCSNVYITGCNLTTFNNSSIGGCLWIRGEMHNVNVRGNKFVKYGSDEAVAVFDRLVEHSSKYIRGKATRTDIFIEDNEFVYGGYNGKDKDPNAVCDMIFSLYTDHRKSEDCCVTRNFHLRNNKFYINDVTTRCMYIGFDPADQHSDIHIENNMIVNNDIGESQKFYHKDIEIHDLSSCGDTIRITGNNIRNKAVVLNDYGSTGYMFLQMRGGNVKMHGNQIVNEVNRSRKGQQYGMQLVWAYEGGILTMTDNVVKGLKEIAYMGCAEGTPVFTLNAFNNYFAGETRVYSQKINEVHLNFTGNTFMSNSENFFLQEFPPKGTVVFNNNQVTITSRNGKFFSFKGSGNAMRFDKLEVRGNVFNGVKSEKELFKNVTNVKKRSISANTITR